MTFTYNERATSTTVNYVLLLGIVTVLVAVLLVSTANVVEGERERAVEAGLTVVGNDLAAELESTSTLAVSVNAPGSVTRTIPLPSAVAGATYTVDVQHVSGDNYRLTLSTASPAETVAVPFVSKVEITERTLSGGDVRVEYMAGADTSMEVTNG